MKQIISILNNKKGKLIVCRNYDIADINSLPSALENLIELFGSEPMFTILGSLTGLTSENDEDEPTFYEPSPKKQKSTSVGKKFDFNFSKFFFYQAEAASSSSPRWYFELRRWKHTYYSLSFDTDNNTDGDEDEEEKDGTLDVMIFFNYQPGIFFDIEFFSLYKIYVCR